MRPIAWLLALAAGSGACAVPQLDPRPTPALIASMPDTIPCEKPVRVEAKTEGKGIAAERRWIDAYYPGHTPYSQALLADSAGRGVYDVLMFNRADGRAVSICFDIRQWFGHW